MPATGRDPLIANQLMTAQTDATDGVWVSFFLIKTFSVHVLNLSGSDVVQIRVSCEASIPSNSAHGVQLGSNITADRIISSANNRFRWLKVRKSTGGGSATDAYLFGEYSV